MAGFEGTFLVQKADGSEYTVEWDGRSVRAWEAHNNASFVERLDSLSVTDITWLAFDAARRAGKATTWEEFDDTVANVEAVNETPKSKKRTRKAPTGG